MKVNFIFLLALSLISIKSFAVTYSSIAVDSSTVSAVIYPTAVSGAATDNIIIFGGSTGCQGGVTAGCTGSGAGGFFGECASPNGNTTCNSCTGMSDFSGTPPLYYHCAYRNVYGGLKMRITFTMDSLPSCGNMKAQWKESNGSSVTVTTCSVSGNQATVGIDWTDLCNAASQDGCAGGIAEGAFSDTLLIGSTTDATLSASNAVKFTVKWHHLSGEGNVTTYVTACPTTGGSGDPFCNFKVLPGDAKVYVTDLVRGSTGPASDASGIKWQYVRVYHATSDCTLPCTPDFKTIPLGANAQYEDLTVLDKSNQATSLSTNKVTSGFTNEVDYKFNVATVDEATVVTGFINPADLNGTNHATRPGEVIGLLDDKHCFIATAAYGSDMAPQVDILRKFRHEFLIPYSWGRSFVRAYYQHSPPVAQFISEHDFLRTLVRGALWPLIALAALANQVGGAVAALIMLVGGLVFYRLFHVFSRRHFQRRRSA